MKEKFKGGVRASGNRKEMIDEITCSIKSIIPIPKRDMGMKE